MATSSYSWDTPTGYSWDEQPDTTRGGSSAGSDSEYEAELTSEVAGENLLNFLEESHASGRLTAKAVCTIAWWGFHAGIATLEKIAVNPSSGTGNFQRKLAKVWEIDDTETYTVEVAAELRHHCSRGPHQLRTFPPHEVLHRDIIPTELPDQIAATTLPPNYYDHIVTKKGQEQNIPVVPLSLYLDGVRVGKGSQAVLGITIHNLLTGQRYLIAAIRKSLQCSCGCKGWCTMAPVFAWLSWSLHVMADGVFPSLRHDDTELDAKRRAKSTEPLGWLGAIVQIRPTGRNGPTALEFFHGPTIEHHVFFAEFLEKTCWLMYSREGLHLL